MQITRISGFTGKEHTLDLPITEEQLRAWRNGALVQDAFPNLTSDQREFLMTGVTADEWNEVFGNVEDEAEW